MREIVAIAINDVSIFVRDRLRFLISVLVVPIGVTFAIGYAIGGGGGDEARLLVDVIDHDTSAMSGAFLAGLREANTRLVLCPMDNDADDFCQMGEGAALDAALAEQRLRDRVALALIEIPPEFEADLQAGNEVSLFYRSNETVTTPSYILQAVQAVVQRMSGAIVAQRVGAQVGASFEALEFADETDRQAFAQAIYDRAAALWAQNPVTVSYTLTQPAQASAGPAGFGQSVPGMATMFVMYNVFGAMMVLMQERRNWTLPRLALMPISRAQLLGGKMLAWFTIGMMQYVVIFAVGLVIGVNFGRDPLALALLMVSYTACVTALSFAVGNLMRSEQQVGAISLLLALTLSPLGGAWWPLEISPQWMQTVGHLSPVAWVMDGFHALMFENGSLSTIIPSLLVLAAMTAALFVFAVRRFRVL